MAGRRRRLVRDRGERQTLRAHVVVLAVVLVVAGVAGVSRTALTAVGHDLPRLDQQHARPTYQNTYIYDGSPKPRLLAVLHGDESRVVVGSRDISRLMKQAVVAIEDARFYSHEGVDYYAIGRAFVEDVKAGTTVQGGSTITQQFIKNTYIDPGAASAQTLSRKLREAVLAYQLEKKWSKDKILTNYLNTIYFGQGAYGVEVAARTFFGTTAKRLTLAQAALLAGVVKDPNGDNPFDDPQGARLRRRLVLDAMTRQGFITDKQAAAAAAAPLPAHPHAVMRSHIAPYFVEYVINQLVREFGAAEAFGGGLRVYTTLDRSTQEAANAAAQAILDRPTDPAVSIVAVDPVTGEVKAMVGGRDFEKQQFNLAVQGRRQPGSAFKPFALAAALDEGISPSTVFVSAPKAIPIGHGGEVWRVSTYSGGYLGPITLREATVQSDNTVYADLAMLLGADRIAGEAERLGMTTPVGTNPSIALGGLTTGVSPLEMASAYATLANGGRRVTGSVTLTGDPGPISIRKVTDAGGSVLFVNRPVQQQAMPRWKAGLETAILQDVVRRGTGTAAALSRPCAGKTGTTQNFSDAWFVGYTPDLAAAVWVGYPDAQRPLYVRGIHVAGGTFPAAIWRTFMTGALAGTPPHAFPAFSTPPTVGVTLCALTGKLATRWCPIRRHVLFFTGQAPTETCAEHGPSDIAAPDVTGLPLAQAQTTLRAAKLRWRIEYAASEPDQKGVVLGQEPGPGGVILQSSAVTLRVGNGPLFVVPKVTGLFVGAARTLVEGAGFTCSIVWNAGGPAGVVTGQSPQAGDVGTGEVTVYAGGDGSDAVVPSLVGLTVARARARLAALGLDAAIDGPAPATAVVSAQSPAPAVTLAMGEAVTLTTQ
jgi:penicillin-binding protein 1A